MALSISQTKALGEILKPGMRVASMGYPDIIAPVDMPMVEFRADSEAICKRHGLKQRPIPDAHSFFRVLGCNLDVFDVVRERGCEILCDLNYPVEETLYETYDIALDVGTLEHCFNIGQAAFNMAGMLKLGGVILHENPLNWANHGFYGLNPTWYADFYQQNGFTLLDCQLIPRDGSPAYSPPLTKRFVFHATEANIFAMARRDEIRKLVYPVQTKYKSLIPAAGVLTGEAAAEQPRAKEIANG